MSTLFSHFFEKINQISPLDADFTEVLESIALMPKMLYFRGKMPENMVKDESIQKPLPGMESVDKARGKRPKTVAIVGSRHNTHYGEEVAYRLAYTLASRGVIVVSGLAFGIDSIAHRGCLDAGGQTVAVLGTPIDQIYPRNHLDLAREIVEKNGAIISEYAPRTAEYRDAPLGYGETGVKNGLLVNPEKMVTREDPTLLTPPFEKREINKITSFLYRNRIISGLSDVVVVVEAAEKSGSLNTATHALEQGKDIFAVPGNINNPYSRGCNRLLSEGASVYTEPDDILKILFPEDYIKKYQGLKKRRLIGDTDVESQILQAIATGVRSGDDIMRTVTMPPEVFNQTITLLEIKGRVKSMGMNNWIIVK